jgi:hypothetical protein
MAHQRSISFDAGVLEQAELRAEQEGRSLDAFVNAAVARAMATAPAGWRPRRTRSSARRTSPR